MSKIESIPRILQLIADGAPFDVRHLYDDQYQILVVNDDFEFHPDQGHDPYFSIIVTGTL